MLFMLGIWLGFIRKLELKPLFDRLLLSLEIVSDNGIEWIRNWKLLALIDRMEIWKLFE